MRACGTRSSRVSRPGLPDVAEVPPPAVSIAGYSANEAMSDLVGGAFRSRRPPRRYGVEPLGWGWQLALVGVAGFVSGIAVYLREPFKAKDLPADMSAWLPALNFVGNPAISILVALATWFAIILGGRVISFGRFGFQDIGSGVAFGWWSATLPMLAATFVGLPLGVPTEAIVTIVTFLIVLHVVPSIAEACDISIGRAFSVLVLGPIALVLIVGACLLAFGFSEKLLGIRHGL